LVKFEYKAPRTLEEALSILDKSESHATVLAGGTDLVPLMKRSQIRPSLIMDVKKIPALNRLEWSSSDGLHIGAAVSLSKLTSFRPLAERYGTLAQACSIIGSTQVRNWATIGGNICNAAPSADTAPALLCLGARAVLSHLHGTRAIPLEDFFLGPGQTSMKQNELLVEIEIPTPSTPSAGCYLKHKTREGMDIAVAGVASFLFLDPQGNMLQDVRIALGAVAPTPIRAEQAEAVLIGRTPSKASIEEAARLAVEVASPISDIRASAEYRKEMVKVLTQRSLHKCCEALGIKI